MDRVVIKLSGSIFSKPAKSTLIQYARMLKEISRKVQPVVVAGGGETARRYIELARQLGADESSLDDLGIEVSRLNARMLLFALGDAAYPSIPRNLDEVGVAAASGRIVVTGGLHPGQSTNATSALIAERVGAKKFINATDVDGIYDSDPRRFRNAKMFRRIKVRDMLALLSSERSIAGTYDLMDTVALKVIGRSRMDTRVIRADVKIIKRAVNGEAVGTQIIT